MLWNSRTTGPGLSEGSIRLEPDNVPPLISTVEITPRENGGGSRSDCPEPFNAAAFSKFHRPSGSEITLMTGSFSTTDLITIRLCSSAAASISAVILGAARKYPVGNGG